MPRRRRRFWMSCSESGTSTTRGSSSCERGTEDRGRRTEDRGGMKIEFNTGGAAAGEMTVRLLTSNARGALPLRVSDAEFSGGPNSMLLLHRDNLLFVGLGKPEKVSAQVVRSAVGTAVMLLRKTGRAIAALDLTEWPQFAGPAVEGALLANYRFEKFRPAKTRPLARMTFIVARDALAA